MATSPSALARIRSSLTDRWSALSGRNRGLVGAAGLAVVILVAVVVFAVCGGGGDDEPAAATTVPPATSTAATDATAPATSATEPPASSSTTRPAESLAEASADLEDAPDGFAPAVTAFYRFVGGAAAEPPGVAPGLAAHVAAATDTDDIDLTGTADWAVLRSGSRIAVATVGDDAILAVDDGDGWRIVGADLPRFGLEAWYGEPVRSVLVIGSDARWDEDVLLARADSLHVLFANPAAGTGAIVGIPRDAWVLGQFGSNVKITSTLANGGPEGTLDVVRDVARVPIEGYIITGFLGFEILGRDYGPISVDVPQRTTGGLPGFPDFEAGPQEIDGEELLLFARIRKTLANGDFDRQLNGGAIILGALDLAQSRGIEDLPRAVWLLLESSHTDLSAEQLATLAASALELDPNLVANVVLPGRVGQIGEASVVFLDDAGAGELWNDAADGEIVGTGS